MGTEKKPLKSLPVINVVLGTAGHIDHGKTALIKRLTGIDADRLKEEQTRGMTIDIGYAHMVVDRKLQLGIIDVPGHERFIKNMVAGATGVGLVILAVAADDGVMPQTREHLEIMEILGVELGAVALTKVDLVDEDLASLAEEDVRDFVQGTFLEGAPIVRVSSHTGQGFDELNRVLSDLVGRAR
ncbi:MAG: GTP-binding protein [Planctomycetota bacterium]|jgi:selenocysteine-specific elongation factor